MANMEVQVDVSIVEESLQRKKEITGRKRWLESGYPFHTKNHQINSIEIFLLT